MSPEHKLKMQAARKAHQEYKRMVLRLLEGDALNRGRDPHPFVRG